MIRSQSKIALHRGGGFGSVFELAMVSARPTGW